MHTSELFVQRMSCSGCEASGREAVPDLPAVTNVEISAQAGRLVVTAEQVVDQAAVVSVVEAAGYRASSL